MKEPHHWIGLSAVLTSGMSALVGYGSSDEDDRVSKEPRNTSEVR